MIVLKVMNRKFEIPCEEKDEEKLKLSAKFLEEKINEIDNLEGESKMIMIALNVYFDYLSMKEDTEEYCTRLEKQLDKIMHNKK